MQKTSAGQGGGLAEGRLVKKDVKYGIYSFTYGHRKKNL